MARPRVFISSTYYDLKYVRSSLEEFVSSMGFEPVLSEKGRIAYTPDIPLDESCYREVSMADICVLIVGGRYGSEMSATKKAANHTFYDRYNSVTRGEYRSAIEKCVPTYILIERPVYGEYATFLKNRDRKGVKYAHVDSVNIFYLVDEILAQPRNSPLQQFDRYVEIEEWLREQWSGLFRELLLRLRTQSQFSSLQAQVAQLSELNKTLKVYLEQVVSTLDPQKSEGIIEAETLRLEEAQIVSLLRGHPPADYLYALHRVPYEVIGESVAAASSLDDFIYIISAKIGSESVRKKLTELHARHELAPLVNELRSLLGYATFRSGAAIPYEVFVSYKRTDVESFTELSKLIQRIGYVPYYDVDNLGGGQSWSDQFLEVLRQSAYVVVLCTKAAVESPARMLDEIRLASENNLTIIPIEFDPGAMKNIFTLAGYEDLDQIQCVSAVDHEIGNRLEDILRRALTRKVRSWLEERRVQARNWAERLNPGISFWEETWRDYFPLDVPHGFSGSVALTARGGSGKSILIARCVRHLLADPEVYPVLVEEAMLCDAHELSRCLGARSTSELPRQVEALAVQPPGVHRSWKPMRVVFIVDGLDQMVTPGDVHQRRLVDGLNLLVNSAPVMIGCRGEVWDSWYAGRVSVHEVPVEELDERRVRSLLQGTKLADQFNPLLQVPFFLDIVLRNSQAWIAGTETEFLQRIWSDAVVEGLQGRRSLPFDTGRVWLLENLAACQLTQLAYEVPLAELRNRPGYLLGYQAGLRELEVAGLLVKQTRRTGQTIRLRHDLLDNYSMAQALLNSPDKLERCRELCRRCDKDLGWSLLATLVQAAHDEGDEILKRELFSEFLFILDHKKFGAQAMTRAWAIVHVLMTCFKPLLPLILQALQGNPVDSLDKDNPDHVEQRPSSLGPPATLTQEALSTLASSFMALHADGIADAEPAIPALAKGLQVWPLKGRLLDALGRFRTNEALAAISSFGRQKLNDRDDLDSLPYVARNLRHFPQPEASALLREIMVDTTLSSRVRRVAAEGLNHLHPGQVPVPPRDEDEIVGGLKIRERDGRYSDWHEVQEYADYVRRRVAQGDRFGPRVLDALIQALQHDQTFVRRSVAQALALFEGPAARNALLNEVLEPAVPAEVRSACLDALKSHLRRHLTDPRERQAFRYLLLRAAQAARHAGAALAENGLLELALDPELRKNEDWLLTAQAAEVLPPSEIPWLVHCSITETEADPEVLRELAEIGFEDVGPDREQKYLFAALKSADGVLDISLAPTTWKLGKNFHNAVRKHPDRFLRDGGSWLEPVPLGHARLPGLAVVHGIVLTSDGRLLAAKRSKKLGYAPGHWSLSFEEQVTDQDVREGDRAFHLAANRGMVEEFGIDVDPSRIHLVSVLLEMDNLNLAAVVLIDALQTLEQIQQSWSGDPPPSHAWEAEALDGIEADPLALDDLAGGADFRLEPLHPTSRIRCAMLARWLRRVDS